VKDWRVEIVNGKIVVFGGKSNSDQDKNESSDWD